MGKIVHKYISIFGIILSCEARAQTETQVQTHLTCDVNIARTDRALQTSSEGSVNRMSSKYDVYIFRDKDGLRGMIDNWEKLDRFFSPQDLLPFGHASMTAEKVTMCFSWEENKCGQSVFKEGVKYRSNPLSIDRTTGNLSWSYSEQVGDALLSLFVVDGTCVPYKEVPKLF